MNCVGIIMPNTGSWPRLSSTRVVVAVYCLGSRSDTTTVVATVRPSTPRKTQSLALRMVRNCEKVMVVSCV